MNSRKADQHLIGKFSSPENETQFYLPYTSAPELNMWSYPYFDVALLTQ